MTHYRPPFSFTAPIVEKVSRISELIGIWSARSASHLTPLLRRVNRIKTIQASLAIEQNTMTEEQVRTILEGKPVMGPPNEINEVRNAFVAYEKMDTWNPSSEKDLFEAHHLLMMGLADEIGRYRSGGVGIYQGNQLVHMAPPSKQLPHLMANLLNWLSQTDLPPLVASCVFHYEFEFIHPFSDGNGRMGRLWQTLILSQWRQELAWLPVETVIKDRQQAYYYALGKSDHVAQATPFVDFMLDAIEDALHQSIAKSDPVNDGVNDVVKDGVLIKLDGIDRVILNGIKENPYMTHEQMVKLTGKSLSTIQRRIRKLRQIHIKRIGSDKTGYWKVND